MIAVLLTTGCSSNSIEGAAPVRSEVERDALSAQALDDLADDQVTYQEYRDGFERFRRCIAESGETIIGISFDPLSGMVDYGVSTGDDICYNREFAAADIAWQLSPQRPRRQRELEQIKDLEACVRSLGATPVASTTSDDFIQQLRDLGADPIECLSSGG